MKSDSPVKPTIKERLFNLLSQEHAITLLESELDEIINLVANSLRGEVVDECVEAGEECPEYTFDSARRGSE